MKFNIHGGHNPDGKIACGATGYIKESTEDRRLAKELIRLLESHGHTCYNCTVDNGTSPNNVLRKICDKCNQHKVDCDVSLHFNRSNGKGHGFEVLYKSEDGKKWAKKVIKSLDKNTKLEARHNGNPVLRNNLWFLNKTNNVAILIENCFCDNKKDCELYDYKVQARAIAEGLTGENYMDTKKKIDTAIVYSNDIDYAAAQVLKWKLKDQADLMPLNAIEKYKIEKVIAIGSSATDLPHADIVLQGEDRFETIRKVLDYIDML